MTQWHNDTMTRWHDYMMEWRLDDMLIWWHDDMMTWWHDPSDSYQDHNIIIDNSNKATPFPYLLAA